jgi:site-specific DNA-methyltransferase (adenine-specific)
VATPRTPKNGNSEAPARRTRTPTATSSFGVTRREGHDASRFYARFHPPEISTDDAVHPWRPLDPFICGDARDMSAIPDNSVALVVTSPPYYVGKEYEEAIGEGHVPATYLDYLDMLAQVFAECKRALEPGGRIAVNVANLGRKPYRSLSADVIHILQDELKLLLRGEVIWQKADGLSSSCAWGSFRKATNPVLRDTTERVIIASKGRFDRALSRRTRMERGLPYESTASADEFMEATLDVWRLPAESATRVGHPAPFPVELPQRLIELYTFAGDLVLDPFMGSGSTLAAAKRTGRAYVGYDLDAAYVEMARTRVGQLSSSELPESSELDNADGKAARQFAESIIAGCGFQIVGGDQPVRGLGLEISIVAQDQKGKDWFFDVSGAFSTARVGLARADTLWNTLGRALLLKRNHAANRPIVLLTTDLPPARSAGERALYAAGCAAVFDVITMTSADGRERLRQYATGVQTTPLAGFWSQNDLAEAATMRLNL